MGKLLTTVIVKQYEVDCGKWGTFRATYNDGKMVKAEFLPKMADAENALVAADIDFLKSLNTALTDLFKAIP